jgi:hypothetical protein
VTRPDVSNRALRSGDDEQHAVASDDGRDASRPPREGGQAREGDHAHGARPSHREREGSPAAFGAERCPAVWVTGATPATLDDSTPVAWVEVARVDDAAAEGGDRWRLAGVIDAPTEALLAADRDDAPLRAAVYGTREGDRWSGPVELDALARGPGDVWGAHLVVGGTGGTIFRWWATGCLACRDHGRAGE